MSTLPISPIPEQVQSEAALPLIIHTLHTHFDRRSQDSKAAVEWAGKLLGDVLHELPPHIQYIAHAASEGVFRFGDPHTDDQFDPVWVVKQVPTLEQAKTLDELTNELIAHRVPDAPTSRYLNIPRTRWPVRVNGTAAIFADAIHGHDLAEVMPALNKAIKNGNSQAAQFKKYLVTTVLDNAAYFQAVAPQLKVAASYKPTITDVEYFAPRAFMQSADLLNRVTDKKMTEDQIRELSAFASRLGEKLASVTPRIALDSGPRNTMVDDELVHDLEVKLNNPSYRSPSMGTVQRATYQVDLPMSFKSVHPLREAVRSQYAPVVGMSFEEAERGAAHFVLRSEYLQAPNVRASESISGDMSRLESGIISPRSVIDSRIEEGTWHLYASVASEAARMTDYIPAVFLSKIRAEQSGEFPKTTRKRDLAKQYSNLVTETHDWAGNGMKALQELESLGEEVPASAYELFENWSNAKIDKNSLPHYTIAGHDMVTNVVNRADRKQ